MRNRLFLSLFAAAALVVGTSASAGSLVSATWTQSLQGVDITVTNSGTTCTSTGANLVQQSITCPTGSGLSPTGSATSTTFNVALTLPAFSLTQFTTGGAINIKTEANVNGGAQSLSGNTAAGITNVAGAITGQVTVKVAAHANKGVNASALTAAATTLVQVPLNAGQAGQVTTYFYVLGNLHYITVDFYAWTTGTLNFTGLTTKGVTLPDVVAMGSVNLTGGGGGTVTLVSPSKISIDGPLAFRRTASFTSLVLTYAAPEPSTLLLLGAGALGLVLVGSRKRG